MFLCGSFFRHESVSCVPNGEEMLGPCWIAFKRLSQTQEKLIDAARLHVTAEIPDFCQEFLAVDNTSFVLCEISEQLQFFVSELDILVIDPNFVGVKIHVRAAEMDLGNFLG